MLTLYSTIQSTEPIIPFFFQVLRSDLLLPIASVFFLGRRPAFFLTTISLCSFLYTFQISVDHEYKFTLTWKEHGGFLSMLIIQYSSQLFYFFAFEREAKIHQLALKKLLNDSENKSEAKTQFISRMSHELRTPLHGMLSCTSLLKQTLLNLEQQSYVSTIDSCGELVLDIVVKILDIAKIESGKFETEINRFNLAELIQHLSESLGILAEKKGIELLTHFDLNNPFYDVEGDQKHLREILVNLVGNALKFTAKGHVKIHVSCVADAKDSPNIYRFEV